MARKKPAPPAAKSGKAASQPTLEEFEALADEIAQRARALGLTEYLLCLAREDRAWREQVERLLSKDGPLGKTLHGARPSSVWKPETPIHRRVVKCIDEDTHAFSDFAMANERVAEVVRSKPPSATEVRERLSLFEALLAIWTMPPDDLAARLTVLVDACDELESLTRVGAAECGVEGASVDKRVPDDRVAEENSARVPGPDTEHLEAELATAKAGVQHLTRELKEARKELRTRTAEVSRKDRKQQELRDRAKSAEASAELSAADAKKCRAERDEALREARRLDALVRANRAGIETVERKLNTETGSAQATIRDLRERVAATQKVSDAMEGRVASLEVELARERERRGELEAAFEAFGIEDMARSAMSFTEAVDALVRIREGIVSYVQREAEREHEHIVAQMAADAERQLAIEAKQAQMQAETAWRAREFDRLQELEHRLYPDGELDHVFIDGHNLVHRIFRPEDEARTRPWLERLVIEMAGRLEETKGWTTVYHLVFDSSHKANTYTAGHGVHIEFASKSSGGADARIAELLRERLPSAHCMVVSTDRKHVWKDALDAIGEDGREVDLVQIELLAEYLQLLDELKKRG